MLKEDWIECSFGEIINFRNGFAFKSNKYNREGIPVIRIGDIKENEISLCDAAKINSSKEFLNYIVNNGDILIAMSGATTGKFGVYRNSELAYQNQRVGNILPKNEDVLYKPFIFYLLHSLKRQIERDAYGGAQPNISSKKIEGMSIYLPPVPIQRAIVKKIEQLFSALDAGIVDLKKAQDQLKVYRQAVLKKAFEGVKESKLVSEFAKVETGATPKRGNLGYWNNGNIPWVTSGSLNNESVTKCDEYITKAAIKETNCKIIPKGSLLIAMYGEGKTRGKCSELKIDAATNQAIASIIINPEYISYKNFVKFFFIKNYNDIRLLSSGGVQPNLNLSIIKNAVIPFPKNDEEQLQIVREIESRLSVCDVLEQQINTSLQQSEALRQSILKKAFAGELLTEAEIAACKKEPDYEPASVLLKRIKSEKEKGRPKISKGSVVPKVKPVIAIVPKVSADIHAGLIAKIIKLHEANPAFKDKLSHIKCEKLAHLVEYHVRIPLGRKPVKDAAGPDDYHHLKSIESRARKAGFFKQKKRPIGYTYVPGNNIDKVISKFESSVSDEQNAKVNALLQQFLPFDLETAEIAATTYAGWNNLIILGNNHPADEEIVTESRENWSKRKLSIPRERFFKAINWLRKKEINLIPTGYGLLVSAPANKKK